MRVNPKTQGAICLLLLNYFADKPMTVSHLGHDDRVMSSVHSLIQGAILKHKWDQTEVKNTNLDYHV